MDLSKLDSYKEGNRLEAKEAQGGLPRSIWASVSAFANTSGGVILLGVAERADKTLEAVGLKDAHRMADDFWNAAHSSDKLSPCVLADKDVRIESVDGKDVLVIEVPRAKRQQRPVYVNGNPVRGTYRRDHTGDYSCGMNEIEAMYRDASNESADLRLHEGLSVADLSAETVDSYRRRYDLYHEGSAWKDLSDEEFLCRIGAARIGEDGEAHPTSAGLLMFGEEWRIMGEFPHYFLDYRQETSPETRWQDRVTSQTDEWPGNVFGFYQRAYDKMRQALKVPFKLDENSLRVDETSAHEALREAIANCLTNADYNERRGVVLLWQEDGLKLSNPGGFRVSVEDAYAGGISDPRNETMMRMFALVRVGERAGSGIPNMVKNWMDAGYGKPVLSEQVNPERSTIFLPLSEETVPDKTNEGFLIHGKSPAIPLELYSQMSDTEKTALRLVVEQGRVTTSLLAAQAGVSKLTATRALKRLVDKNVLAWRGRNMTDPAQYYEVVESLRS